MWARKLGTALVFLALHAHAAWAARVAVVLSDKIKVYNQISQGLLAGEPGEVKEFPLAAASGETLAAVRRWRPDVVVAIGDEAGLWAKRFITDVPVVPSGVAYQLHQKEFANMPGVYIDMPPADYLSTILDALPSAGHRVGVLFNPERGTRYVEDLRRAAGSMGMEIYAQGLNSERDIGKAMNAIKKNDVDVFLMTYEPFVMNPETWQYLVGFFVTNRIACLVPSRGLLKSGGVLSLEADYEQLGRQTAAVVKRLLEDPAAKNGMAFPAKREVGINLKMAELFEMVIAEDIQKRAEHVYK